MSRHRTESLRNQSHSPISPGELAIVLSDLRTDCTVPLSPVTYSFSLPTRLRSSPKGGSTMRALLIDPEARLISEVDIDGSCEEILDLLNTNHIAVGAELLGSDVWIYDDYQDEIGENPKHWYQLDADRNSRLFPPHAGRGLVIGVDRRRPWPHDDGIQFYEGLLGPDYRHSAHCDALTGIEDLAARITFTRRVFRDYYEHDDGFLSIVAPIVEEA
jgi:hypothetical protein